MAQNPTSLRRPRWLLLARWHGPGFRGATPLAAASAAATECLSGSMSAQRLGINIHGVTGRMK
jgi:hypothetical protein